jgi:hypothetical protein
LPNGCTQALSIDQASTRIDHRHSVAANNETDVGYCVFVLRRDVFIHAAPDVDSVRDFVSDKRVRFCGERYVPLLSAGRARVA